MNVTIVIVNWNTGKLLSLCLQSIKELPEKDLIAEVVVVDNKSHDDSVMRAKRVEMHRPTTFITLPQNLGFAAANNMGIRGRRTKESHVLLLNPDTQLRPQAISAALHELEKESATGIVGVTLLNPDGSIQPSVRTFPLFLTFVFYFLKLHILLPTSEIMTRYLLPDFDYTKRQRVDQVMGAFFLIRHELLEEIGLLDEKFWVWFEEVDFCRRAHDAGWNVIYTPAASVMHYGGASFHQLVGLRKTLPFLHSALIYTRKHLGLLAYALLLLLWPVALVLSLPASLKHTVMRRDTMKRL